VLSALLPAAAAAFTARDLAVALNQRPVFPPRLVVVRERVGSLVFYLDAERRHALSDRLTVAQPRDLPAIEVPPGTLVAMASRDLRRAAVFVHVAGVPYQTAGRYRLYDAAALGVRIAPESRP
jgi:hypothetical protein